LILWEGKNITQAFFQMNAQSYEKSKILQIIVASEKIRRIFQHFWSIIGQENKAAVMPSMEQNAYLA